MEEEEEERLQSMNARERRGAGGGGKEIAIFVNRGSEISQHAVSFHAAATAAWSSCLHIISVFSHSVPRPALH